MSLEKKTLGSSMANPLLMQRHHHNSRTQRQKSQSNDNRERLPADVNQVMHYLACPLQGLVNYVLRSASLEGQGHTCPNRAGHWLARCSMHAYVLPAYHPNQLIAAHAHATHAHPQSSKAQARGPR